MSSALASLTTNASTAFPFSVRPRHMTNKTSNGVVRACPAASLLARPMATSSPSLRLHENKTRTKAAGTSALPIPKGEAFATLPISSGLTRLGGGPTPCRLPLPTRPDAGRPTSIPQARLNKGATTMGITVGGSGDLKSQAGLDLGITPTSTTGLKKEPRGTVKTLAPTRPQGIRSNKPSSNFKAASSTPSKSALNPLGASPLANIDPAYWSVPKVLRGKGGQSHPIIDCPSKNVVPMSSTPLLRSSKTPVLLQPQRQQSSKTKRKQRISLADQAHLVKSIKSGGKITYYANLDAFNKGIPLFDAEDTKAWTEPKANPKPTAGPPAPRSTPALKKSKLPAESTIPQEPVDITFELNGSSVSVDLLADNNDSFAAWRTPCRSSKIPAAATPADATVDLNLNDGSAASFDLMAPPSGSFADWLGSATPTKVAATLNTSDASIVLEDGSAASINLMAGGSDSFQEWLAPSSSKANTKVDVSLEASVDSFVYGSESILAWIQEANEEYTFDGDDSQATCILRSSKAN